MALLGAATDATTGPAPRTAQQDELQALDAALDQIGWAYMLGEPASGHVDSVIDGLNLTRSHVPDISRELGDVAEKENTNCRGDPTNARNPRNAVNHDDIAF